MEACEVTNDRGKLYYRLRDFKEARAVLKASKCLDRRMYFYLARSCFELRKYREAQKYFALSEYNSFDLWRECFGKKRNCRLTKEEVCEFSEACEFGGYFFNCNCKSIGGKALYTNFKEEPFINTKQFLIMKIPKPKPVHKEKNFIKKQGLYQQKQSWENWDIPEQTPKQEPPKKRKNPFSWTRKSPD